MNKSKKTPRNNITKKTDFSHVVDSRFLLFCSWVLNDSLVESWQSLRLVLSSLDSVVIQFRLKQTPRFYTPLNEKIYFASSFNQWRPNDKLFEFNSATKTLLIDFQNVTNVEFKLTRGSWSTTETWADGTARANRKISLVNRRCFFLFWSNETFLLVEHTSNHRFNCRTMGRYGRSCSNGNESSLHFGHEFFDVAAFFTNTSNLVVSSSKLFHRYESILSGCLRSWRSKSLW